MIAQAVAKALSQLLDPRFRGVLLKGVAWALAGLVVLHATLLGLLRWLLPDSLNLPWIGEVGWLDEAGLGAGLIVLLVASVFLMIPVASAVISFFLDEVADAVEARHYPTLAPAPRLRLADTLAEAAGFFALLLVANLVGLIGWIAGAAPRAADLRRRQRPAPRPRILPARGDAPARPRGRARDAPPPPAAPSGRPAR